MTNNKLPPQNIDTEESILGGILLDPQAIGRVADLLPKEAFYVTAHQNIYEAALKLHSQGKPTDLTTVTIWLEDQGLLEASGGISKLAQLVERTVSAVNIDRYAELLMEKYTRRQLIAAGNEIADLGYDTAQELESVLDQSEQKIFGLTQKRVQQGLIPIGETLTKTFSEIEKLQQQTDLPGIPTDFYDLDAMTSGFQRSDLIIIAGRPSMGKCCSRDTEIVTEDGSMATIEDIYHRRQGKLLTLKDTWQFGFTEPSAFVDDGIKPVWRTTTALGRFVETTMTHPYLTTDGWRQLSQLTTGVKIAVPRHIDVFGTETMPLCEVKLLAYSNNKTIPEIVFRLKRSLLSLFLNRLFATNGRVTQLECPRFSITYTTFREKIARQVQHLLLRFGVIAALKKGYIEDNIIWQLDITEANSLKTFIHEIGIFGKDKELIAAGEALLNKEIIPLNVSRKFVGSETSLSLLEKPSIKGSSSFDSDGLDNQNLSDIYWDEIVSIEYIGNQQVYDLTIPDTHNFVANDICVHNTSFALNIAANIAKQDSLSVAIFSLEMSKNQLAQRLLASEAKIAGNRLRSGRLSQTELEAITLALGNISEVPIFIDDSANLTVMQMRSEVRRLQAQQKKELGLVLLDYLQLMEGGSSDNRVQELSKITRSLKGLARELNVPIIALSQLSRGVEQRTNKRPMMSDLRESGSIEQDADLVIMLYRDSYYNPDSPKRNIAEINIVKHRNGPTGQLELLFNPELTKFENLAKPNSY